MEIITTILATVLALIVCFLVIGIWPSDVKSIYQYYMKLQRHTRLALMLVGIILLYLWIWLGIHPAQGEK